MAFLQNRTLTKKEEQRISEILNDKKPLSDNVKQRLKKLNKKLDIILKVQNANKSNTNSWSNKTSQPLVPKYGTKKYHP